jgi:hypothetical protein
VQDIAIWGAVPTCDASSYMTGAEPVIDGSMAARDSIGAEVDGWRSAAAASAKCDFSGKFHSNISMDDSAKVALLGSCSG